MPDNYIIGTSPSGNNGGWIPLEPGDPGYNNVGGNGNSDYNFDAMDRFNNLPDMDFLSAPFLLGNVGAPFVIGLAVGYFAKKVLKIALFLGGAAVVFLFVSEYYGITKLSDSGLQNAANTATDMAKQSGGFLVDRLSHISTKGVSAVTGFFVGLKFG